MWLAVGTCIPSSLHGLWNPYLAVDHPTVGFIRHLSNRSTGDPHSWLVVTYITCIYPIPCLACLPQLSRSCIQNYRRESVDWRHCYPTRGEFPDCPPNKGEKSGICLNPRRGCVRTLFHLIITCGSLVFCQEFRSHANNVRSIAHGRDE